MRGGFKDFVRSNKNASDDKEVKKLLGPNLKLIKEYLTSHVYKLIIAISATLLVSISALIGPYLIKIAIDDYIIPGDFPGLILISILIFLSYGLSWFSTFWQTYLAEWIGQDIISSIRQDLFYHIQDLNLTFFNNRRTGDIMSRITHDVNTLTELITGGFIHFISDFFTLFAIFAIMFWMDPTLSLIVFILLPLVMLIFWLLGKKMRDAYHNVREEMARLNTDIEENVSGIRTVKALNREKLNQENFQQISLNNLEANLRAVSIFSLFFPAMNFSRVLGEALVLGYGGIQVIEGSMTIGVLAAFLGYVRRFFRPIMDLSQVYNTYQSAGAALDRINEYLKIPGENQVQEKAPFNIEQIRGSIQFENVNFSYDNSKILESFGLYIPAKNTTALVGASGAGKSTVINLLTRLYEPDKGSVMIDEVDVRNIPPKRLRSVIGVVSQNVQMFNRTIEDNIKYGSFQATSEKIREAAKKTHAHEFIKDLPDGYNSLIGNEGIKLSGGQRQLISLTRVILKDPKILVFDEPTSNVDTHTESLIINAIEKLLKEKTIILISHRLSTIKAADEIVFMSKGKILNQGTHSELLKNTPSYRELFKHSEIV